MKLNIRKHWSRVTIAIQIVIVLSSIGLMPRATALPEWDHSKPNDGLFLIDFDSSGRATAVHVVKSTGDPHLDATTIGKLKRWTCKPGKYKHVYVPVHPEQRAPKRWSQRRPS